MTTHDNTRYKHPCPERDSNPRSQQPSISRPTPLFLILHTNKTFRFSKHRIKDLEKRYKITVLKGKKTQQTEVSPSSILQYVTHNCGVTIPDSFRDPWVAESLLPLLVGGKAPATYPSCEFPPLVLGESNAPRHNL
jgi:hypothetical protein